MLALEKWWQTIKNDSDRLMARTTLILFGLTALMYSCSIGSETTKTTIDIMNDSIRIFIERNADDPRSYEPVETVLIDTVTFLQNINKQIDFYERAAKSFEEFGEHGQESQEGYLKDKATFLAMRDSLLNSPTPDSPAAFIVLHKCRLKNIVGALTLSSLIFEFRPNLTVYHTYVQGTGKSKGYPGGFPNHD